MERQITAVLIAATCGLGIAACGSSSGTATSASSTTIKAPTTTTTALATTTSAPVATTIDPGPVSSPGSDNGANPFGGNDPEDEQMPDVMCMDLQSAQNEIQDHGIFLSGSTDASGQGRKQVIDSNWVVVDQYPDPGMAIGEGDAELFVVKIGETGAC